jgi:hypothetical protein
MGWNLVLIFQLTYPMAFRRISVGIMESRGYSYSGEKVPFIRYPLPTFHLGRGAEASFSIGWQLVHDCAWLLRDRLRAVVARP